jgi:hypothetical protein
MKNRKVQEKRPTAKVLHCRWTLWDIIYGRQLRTFSALCEIPAPVYFKDKEER